MNLAVHGLAGDIRESNTYYEDMFDVCRTNVEPSPVASRHPLPLGEDGVRVTKSKRPPHSI